MTIVRRSSARRGSRVPAELPSTGWIDISVPLRTNMVGEAGETQPEEQDEQNPHAFTAATAAPTVNRPS